MYRLIFLLPVLLAACGDNEAPRMPSLAHDGDACTTDAECASGMCVVAFGDGAAIAGGVCTSGCTWDEEGNGDSCPDGEICMRYNATGEYLCLELCDALEDCRLDEGWLCTNVHDSAARHACLPPL